VRILVVSQMFWPENFRINDLVAEMVSRDHVVTVMTGLPNYPEGRIFPEFRQCPAKFANYAGAEIVRVPVMQRGQSRVRLVLNYMSFVLSGCIAGSWKLRGRQFDVILVCQLSPVTVGLPGILLRSLKRAPLAFWVLDVWPQTLKAIGAVESDRILSVVGALVSFIYRRCDLILAQSQSFIPQIARYAPKGAQIRYFPSWAEDLFYSASKEVAPEIQSVPGSFNVMFAGNIGDAQDFPAILEAAELLKPHSQIRWLIVGDGRSAEWVRSEIRRRGLEERVLMVGRFPVERMPSFYRHADALLVSLADRPIFEMTIPGKLQSYLAAGIAIVAMLNGEGAALIERYGAGITCRAGRAADLAKAVLEMSELPPEKIAEMGNRALEASKREFDRTMRLSQLETWLEELSVANKFHSSAGPSL
jgi:colanic acid biosynthesis glycosyl transferase WcaI